MIGNTASASVNEGSTTVGTYAATDADSGTTIVYSVSGGQDSGLFTVDTASGALTFTNAPDFEDTPCGANTDSNTCTVELTATDNDNTNTDTITVTVTIR